MQTALSPWAAKNGGTAIVASDPHNFWAQAYMKSESPRVLICFDSETPRGPFQINDATRKVDRLFKVAVTRGRGYNAVRGTSITNTVLNARPFADLYEEVRDQLRCLLDVNNDDGGGMYFKGSQSIEMDGLNMDGWVMDVQALTDLPGVVSQPDIPEIPQ